MNLLIDLLTPDAATMLVLNIVFSVLMILSGILAWAFAVAYWAFYPWTRNRSGRAVMFLVLSLASVLTLVVLGRAFHDYPGRVFLTLIIFAAVPLALTSLLVALLSKWHHSSGPATVRSERVAHDFERTIPPKRKAKK